MNSEDFHHHGNFIDEDKDEGGVVESSQFFDAEESIAASGSDSDSDPGCCSSSRDSAYAECKDYLCDVWTRSPRTVRERRNKFLSWMADGLCNSADDDGVDKCGGDKTDVDRVVENSGAVLRNSGLEDDVSSVRELGSFMINYNSDCRRECNGGSNLEEEHRRSVKDVNSLQSPRAAQNRTTVQGEIETGGLKNRLLRRLRSMSCIMVDSKNFDNRDSTSSIPAVGTKVQRIKVRHNKKPMKELSALFKGQNIQAHDGSILAMKFSFDGHYLASAGEDKIVRVWQVVEDDRVNDIDVPEIDPSCLYFTVNHLSELSPLVADKEKMNKWKSLRKSSDSACIIFPPKVFRIMEKPLHEFSGHTADVLDLSWSKNNCLLSSSVDKSVRLWKVGCDQCLDTFSHSNYVTCAQFNPVNDNCFITGSIDGKVRIWEVSASRVVDWIDTRDIITAVCYRPDGEGGIIGSLSGACRNFSVADDRLQLGDKICLTAKKKSLCKRITSIQFSPRDSSKVLITCADSQVRILSGSNVIRKYKGPRSSGNQISASFTSDGKHMISSCEDSNVYMWDAGNLDDFSPSAKTVNSFECFPADASVVVPWFGLQRGNPGEIPRHNHNSAAKLPFSPACFSLGQEFFLESIPRGSATWPEEKLPARKMAPNLSKSQFKFLKMSFQSLTSSHAWGMVMVTAGWDGRIRSFHNYGLPIPT